MITRERLVEITLVLLLAAVPIAAQLLNEPFYLTLATRVAILGLAAVGLNIALGLGGLVSFGHAAFFGVGGYVAGVLAIHAFNGTPMLLGLPGTKLMPFIWIVAILVSGLVALGIGALTLRTSGVYFIMITLAFAQMIYYFAISWPAYGGEDGLSFYVRNGFPGVDTLKPLPFLLICYALLALGLILFQVLRKSRFGAALQGARQNEVRVAATGISPYRIRLVAFVIWAMITGVAGALYADLNRFVSPAMLSWHMSGELIVLIVLGGVGRRFGPVVGAGLYVLLEYWLGGITERWQLFLGLMLLGVVLFARGGLIGLLAGKPRHG
ncbi:branched-chain amino acid transport system permease protein [Devosia enhydra]|uniref:Branched-chain amino acid transport system permease protein n=1 Tax=Devosia enhydra TaxID=665118 RepID=A0A1K2HX81_9HYPH|nr:branched-chain amino acid ABC transporter permease [Devosia enhydra]SFZ83778.1 branched-chain amino acid transport system permease protein [Devosia enhydra]